MKAIGYIVVIALIVFCAVKFSKKKCDATNAENPDENQGDKSTSLEDLVNNPAGVIQEKLGELGNKVSDQVNELTESVPLVNNIPSVEKVVIVEQKPVAPVLTKTIPILKQLKVGTI